MAFQLQKNSQNIKNNFLTASGSANYISYMDFEWDQDKSDTCFVQRGFDFAYVIKAFLDPGRTVRKDDRWNYEEERYQLPGKIENRLFFLLLIPFLEIFFE